MTSKKSSTNDFEQSLRDAAQGQTARPDEQSRSRNGDSRAADESAQQERPVLDNWAPPSLLELPENDADYVYRFIAEYVNGQHVPNNVQRARREGYEFVHIAELPDGFVVDEDQKGDGLARVGGLIMARMPRRFAEQRQAHYRRKSREALHGANALQGVAGANTVEEDRGTRALDGRAAGDALRSLARSSA